MANCGFLSYETVGIYAPCSTKNIQFWKGNKGDVTQETVSIQRSLVCSLHYCTHFTSRTALPLSRNEGMEKQVAQTCFLWAGRENCFFQKQCDFVWFIKQEVLLWRLSFGEVSYPVLNTRSEDHSVVRLCLIYQTRSALVVQVSRHAFRRNRIAQ
jgi:hypothetical protein